MSTAPNGSRIARLALADGTIFRGKAFGATDTPITTSGEVVFNTAMVGYQESLTDPSYSGQIMTLTAPMIGNYGVAPADIESGQVQVAGFIVREVSRNRSNYRSDSHLCEWLADQQVLGIEGIDTRALVRRLRIDGAMPGVLSSDESIDDGQLVSLARATPAMGGQDLATDAGPTDSCSWSEGLGDWQPVGMEYARVDRSFKVVALDCGAKRNIYRNLANAGCEVVALPAGASAADIRKENPDGLFVSNGPGDPAAVEATIATLKQVAGEIPTFGICLGHQLLALAMGATTYKLPFGHRGANQPVRNLLTGSIEITSQNHGFCVDPESLARAGGEMTHIHLNDGTLAGFRLAERPVFSVQYHPEASPGPHDSGYLFGCFTRMMASGRPVDREMMAEAQDAVRGAGTREHATA